MKKSYLTLLFIALTMAGCKSSMLVDPTTIIRYIVHERSHVKLTVENNYNTVVATLVDMEKEAGVYSVSFDASGYAEGVYFYTLECTGIGNNFYSKITKQLLLVK